MHMRFGPQEKCMQLSPIFCKFPSPTYEKNMWQEEHWSGAFMFVHVVKVSSTERMSFWMFQDKMSA